MGPKDMMQVGLGIERLSEKMDDFHEELCTVESEVKECLAQMRKFMTVVLPSMTGQDYEPFFASADKHADWEVNANS